MSRCEPAAIERAARARAIGLRRAVRREACRTCREGGGLRRRSRAASLNRTCLARGRGWQRRAERSRSLAGIAAALGCDLSVRLFPGTGPRIRDRIQVAMSEALLASLHPRWRAAARGAGLPAGSRRDRPRADGPDGPRSSCRRSCRASSGASSSRSDGRRRRRTRCASTAGAGRRPCRPPARGAKHGGDARGRPSRRPDAWPPRTRPGRPTPSRALTGGSAVAGRRHVVGERRARPAASSMGRPAGSRSGDSIVVVKKIGFLSFGHWSEAPYSQVRSGSDALLQSIELAVAAEELGADGAYFRVHHFARQLALAVSAAGRDRRANTRDRDRHGRHRHALREPAVHGRGRRARPTSSPAAGSSWASAAGRRSR